MERAEVVIVGGGPAGLTTAIALLHADPSLAERVVLLEKARYPREKYCAGGVGGRGDKILASLDARPDVPSVPVDGISFRAARGEQRAVVGGIGRVVRRIEFDAALAGIARARGVRILEDAQATRVEADARGATVYTSRGEYRARIVAGADGVGSVVRKAIGLGAGRLRAQVLELDTEPVDGDPERTILHFDAADRGLTGYYWDFPTIVGGEELICRGIYHLRMREDDVDIHARLAERMEGMGLDITKYKNKRYAERGFDPTEPVGKGPLLLVGEAAGIDPITGEGIAQAIEYGAMAGTFIHDALRGTASLDRWSEHVRTSRLGRDLRIRRRLTQSFFGPARPDMERLLLESDRPLRAGCRHFAAMSFDWGALAGVAYRVSALWLKRRLAGPDEAPAPAD